MNMECSKDYFDVGRHELKNVVAERKKELASEERRLEIIYDAVDFFKKKMTRYMAELDEIMALSKSDTIVESEPQELELAEAIKDFDVEKYINGNYE